MPDRPDYSITNAERLQVQALQAIASRLEELVEEVRYLRQAVERIDD